MVESKSKKFIQCVQNSNKNATPKDTIYAIKNAGFDGVFLQWYNKDWEFSQEEQLRLCRELGLEIAFVHLGYKGINNIWDSGEEGESLVENYLKDLDVCKNNGIEMVVMHPCSKIEEEPSELGIKRFQKIVDYADKLNIKIAFENTKTWGYLEYIFDNIKNSNIGICFDSGHCHCHFEDRFNWDKFKNRIFAVHLHDNNSLDDQHLLPFDGSIDWENFAKELKNANYNGPIILESTYRNEYLKMSLEEFYKLSFERAKELDI